MRLILSIVISLAFVAPATNAFAKESTVEHRDGTKAKKDTKKAEGKKSDKSVKHEKRKK